MNNTQTYLAPQYYKAFKCPGSSCSDDCCRGMLVKVDEETYKKYTSLSESPFRGRLLGHIVVGSEAPFAASILRNKDKECPFRRRDGLCDIQCEHGHGYLPYPCRTYPRMFRNAGGMIEAYLNMGCEEAARQALFHTGKMKLRKIHLDTAPLRHSVLKPETYIGNENALEIFRMLRDISVCILQLRKYRFWFRAVMLGFLIQRAGKLLAEGNSDKIPEFIGEYRESLDNADYEKHKDIIPGRDDMKIARIYSFFAFIANTLYEDKRGNFCECFDMLGKGLGITGLKQPVPDIAVNYASARDLHYAPYFDSREYIFENYMVNTVLSSGFPFSYGNENKESQEAAGDIYGNFVSVAVRYSMLKFLMVGIAGYKKGAFGHDDVIKAVSAFSRVFDHDKELTDAIVEGYVSVMPSDMPSLCTLLKD